MSTSSRVGTPREVWYATVLITVIGLPSILFSTAQRRRIEKLNALGEWVRTLSSLLGVSGGLEGSIMASVRSTQAPIQADVAAKYGVELEPEPVFIS